MAMPREQDSSQRIRRDAGFHHAALLADPNAQHLAGPVDAERKKLAAAADTTEDMQGKATEALAVLLRGDFELDDRVRKVNRELLVDDDRSHPTYRAAFPGGLSAVIALRGEAQAREVTRLIGVLEEYAPEVAKKHAAALDKLAAASIADDKAWQDSEIAAGQAFAFEKIARTQLIEQLQKNEGALMQIYPGQRRRVRSFFRPAHRRGAAPETGEPETDAEA